MTNHFFIAFHPTKKFFHMVTNHLQERFRLRIDKIQFNSKCVADIHWIDAFPYQSSAGNFPQFQNPSETQVGNVETKEDYPNKTGSGRFWKTENGCSRLFVFKVRNYNLVAEENWNESLLLLLKNNFVRVGNKKRRFCQGCVFVKSNPLEISQDLRNPIY